MTGKIQGIGCKRKKGDQVQSEMCKDAEGEKKRAFG